MLKAIHAQEDRKAAEEKAKAVVERLKEMKLKEAAKKVEDSVLEALTYMSFPRGIGEKSVAIMRLSD